MFERIVLCVAMCVTGYNGLFPDPPKPLTPAQLQVKAKEESISAMCDRKPKSKEAKDLCRRWREHHVRAKN
jgi:hypothetical protein